MTEFAMTEALSELDQQGFTVVRDIFTPEEIEEMKKSYALIRSKANFVLSSTDSLERRWEENGQETISKYWKYRETHLPQSQNCIVLQAGEGRYDLWKGFASMIPDHILNNQRIEQLMKNLLKNNYSKYSGVIMSNPSSKDQYFHRDTDCLQNSGSDGRLLVQMDPFYFTVLIPISVEMTLLNGTTEFMVGSHRKSANEFGDLPLVQAKVPLGSAIVFDGKINHRGKGNGSDEERPCIYQVYHKRWYNDQFRNGVCED